MASEPETDVKTEVETCAFQVSEPPGYWHSHRCGRPVKATITTREGTERGVCGIHKRMNDRLVGRPLSDQDFQVF